MADPDGEVARRASFFFQAEDGIRDRNVTGVQTCALPISGVTASTSTCITTPRFTRRSASRVGKRGCGSAAMPARRSEEHTSELQSRFDLVCRLLLEKKNTD